MNKIPTSWEDINIGLFQEIFNINLTTDDEDTKSLKYAALINGISYDEIIAKPIDETTEMVSRIAFLYREPHTHKVRKTYTLGGHTYRVCIKPSNITTAQYIDFQNILPTKDERLAQYFSIFFIPEGHKYNDGYDLDEVVEDISNHLSIEDAVSVANSFLTAYKKSTSLTLLFLEARMTSLRVMTRDKDLKETIANTEQALKNARAALGLISGCRWSRV